MSTIDLINKFVYKVNQHGSLALFYLFLKNMRGLISEDASVLLEHYLKYIKFRLLLLRIHFLF